MGTKKIIQIIPAVGWLALYQDGQGRQFPVHVSAWALVQLGDGSTDVEGLLASDYVDFCEDADNFDEYVHESRYANPK